MPPVPKKTTIMITAGDESLLTAIPPNTKLGEAVRFEGYGVVGSKTETKKSEMLDQILLEMYEVVATPSDFVPPAEPEPTPPPLP